MLPHHPALAAKLNRQSALGLTALTASWLLGTASIDRGLVQDGSDIFAILGFLTACALWLSTRHTLTGLPRVQIVEAVLLGWWTLNLALCAATGGEIVYESSSPRAFSQPLLSPPSPLSLLFRVVALPPHRNPSSNSRPKMKKASHSPPFRPRCSYFSSLRHRYNIV
jgi:hypothetical protein